MMWIVFVVRPILLLWPHKRGGHWHGGRVLECMLVWSRPQLPRPAGCGYAQDLFFDYYYKCHRERQDKLSHPRTRPYRGYPGLFTTMCKSHKCKRPRCFADARYLVNDLENRKRAASEYCSTGMTIPFTVSIRMCHLASCHTDFTILLATCFSHASLANILNDSRTYFSRLTKARDHLARQIRKLLLLKGLTASHEVFECWHDEACGN